MKSEAQSKLRLAGPLPRDIKNIPVRDLKRILRVIAPYPKLPKDARQKFEKLFGFFFLMSAALAVSAQLIVSQISEQAQLLVTNCDDYQIPVISAYSNNIFENFQNSHENRTFTMANQASLQAVPLSSAACPITTSTPRSPNKPFKYGMRHLGEDNSLQGEDSSNGKQIVWTGLAGDYQYGNPANWSSGFVPGSTDDALINSINLITVTNAGNFSVHNLTCSDGVNFTITGSLTVLGSGSIAGNLALEMGASLTAQGQGAHFVATGSVSADGSDLFASKGGTLTLPGLLTYSYAENSTRYLQASDAGSLMNLPNLNTIKGPTNAYNLAINALNGATINLNGVTNIFGSLPGAVGSQAQIQSSGLPASPSRNAVTETLPADGTSAFVNWNTYAELAQGDVAQYWIHVSTNSFASVDGLTPYSQAQLAIPSNGSDGALVVNTDTVLNLRSALPGNWDDINVIHPGSGVYDPVKSAVVYHFTSIKIAAGATLSFINNAPHTPVVFLVSGDATIDGNINLDGQAQVPAPGFAEPGPGGFRGGSDSPSFVISTSAGFDPGGGQIRVWDPSRYAIGGGGGYGFSGNYATVGSLKSTNYCNPYLIPLVGGSGAGGTTSYGGAGGGAISIACSGTFLLNTNAVIHANGGSGFNVGSGGSGGGVRIVANILEGTGKINCVGRATTYGYGGFGRIRIERVTNANTITTVPDPSVITLSPGDYPAIWLPINGPSLRILSIGSTNVPADPKAGFGTIGPDVALPSTTLTPCAKIAAGPLTTTVTNFSPYEDHYFAVGPVDAGGNYAHNVTVAEINAQSEDLVSREVSLVVVPTTLPQPVGLLSLNPSPDGATVGVSWSGYSELAQGAVSRYLIFVSPTPFTSVAGLSPYSTVPAGTLATTVTNLAPGIDHYFAVAAADANGNYDTNVTHSAAYALTADLVSREISLQVIRTNVPGPVTGVNSGFTAVTAPNAYGAIYCTWPNYSELAQTDVLQYRIYVENDYFNDVSAAQPYASIPAGTGQCVIGSLAPGSFYYVAVVAEDAMGNINPTVEPVRAQASSGHIGEVVALRARSGPDFLVYQWAPPPNAAGFLQGYRVVLDAESLPIKLPANSTTFTNIGLAPASAHSFAIQTLDVFGSPSSEAVINAATLLNPPQLLGNAANQQANLNWSVVQPVNLLSYYSVYVEPFAFSTTQGLTPFRSTTANSATVTGLLNGQSYYFGVTAINISGGESMLSDVVLVVPQDQAIPGAAIQLLLNPWRTNLNIGDSFLSRLTLTNSGSANLTGVQMTNSVPAALEIENVSANRGLLDLESDSITWSLNSLKTNSQFILNVTLTALQPGTFTNQFTVSDSTRSAQVSAGQVVTVGATTPVSLQIQRDNQDVIISWPATAYPAALQTSTGLGDDTQWTTVVIPPQLTGNQQSVRIQPGAQSQFYRLRKLN